MGRKLLYLLLQSCQQSSGQKEEGCVPVPGSVPSRRGHVIVFRQHGSLKRLVLGLAVLACSCLGLVLAWVGGQGLPGDKWDVSDLTDVRRLSSFGDRRCECFRYDTVVVYVGRVIVDVYSFRVLLCSTTFELLEEPRLVVLVWRDGLGYNDGKVVELGYDR